MTHMKSLLYALLLLAEVCFTRVVGLSSPIAFNRSASKIKVGDKLPSSDFQWGFNPPIFVNVPMHVGSRRVLMVGVKGAFLPKSVIVAKSYVENSDILKKEHNIDEVMVYAVNDGAVMGIWQKKVLQTSGSIVTCFADPAGEFTNKIGLPILDDQEYGLVGRCPNFAILVENCVVQLLQECDPSDDVESVCAPALMEILQKA
mmetsp:Transcript_25307/g.58464  ORF Transcript_25307/g.58464 Transcript_25307/m.58464 type:complete len:202 (-) Transcript_25307:173-778(-)|eukprot:CAMPEP_0113315488 /NCGR_PEP_ID=MMETSP0010_2-20120614/11137_1 /TAXON_ID=216773 ORGANISM="Corethron hystrix, Strain 308" /NCGR_SAMPLE_ID=MMETSP0010_2 /ASSEMBLY_ACC=CAM_ASM_000155 /LENGTH=201 /DNA_ID=CAMNT_0000172001 /DNA_START=29 /DNA_END=634 /DNA_ORIENTATION=+ /assembly_acc=CAM_ASM_000155